MKKGSCFFLIGALIFFAAAISPYKTIPHFSIAYAAPLTGVTNTASNYVVSTYPTTHTISFVTASSDTIGKVAVKFSAGFSLLQISLGNFSGIPTGSLSVNGDTVLYTVTQPETITAGATCSIQLLKVGNAATCANTYTVTLSTWTSADTLIDGPTPSNTFALTGNIFRITTPAQVISKNETSSLFSVLAGDAWGNTDVTFNNTVTLSSSSDSGQFLIGNSWSAAGSDTEINLDGGKGSFYYRDASADKFIISLSRAGYQSAEQTIKVVQFLSGPVSPDSATIIIASLTNFCSLTIPAGAFGSTISIIITENPSSAIITQANISASGDPSRSLLTELDQTIHEIGVFKYIDGYVHYNQPLNPLSGKSITLTVSYPAGVTGPSEEGLRICRLDENTRGWIRLETSQHFNKQAREIFTALASLSIYRLISFPVSANLAELIVYPNPYEMASARDGTLKFIMLPSQVEIKIYSLSGKLVKTLTKNDQTNYLCWDGRNEWGEKVSSGLYFYVISSEQDTGKRTGKIAIIGN